MSEKRGGKKRGGGGALFPIVPLHVAPCGAVSGSRAADLGTPCGAAPDSGQDVSLLLLVPSFSFFFPMSVCLFLFFSSFFPRSCTAQRRPNTTVATFLFVPTLFFCGFGFGVQVRPSCCRELCGEKYNIFHGAPQCEGPWQAQVKHHLIFNLLWEAGAARAYHLALM